VAHHEGFAPGLGIPIGMAYPGGFDFDQDFVALGSFNLDCIDDKMTFPIGNSGLAPHQIRGLRAENLGRVLTCDMWVDFGNEDNQIYFFTLTKIASHSFFSNSYYLPPINTTHHAH
jgi:hypothetical protein